MTVNWKFYDGFEAKKTFWTDSNGLEMQQRKIRDIKTGNKAADEKPLSFTKIAGNYFPVTSAIAMRDFANSDLQVTIMNDRPQGGAADLSDSATIELMQHRRLLADDNLGLVMHLNETDADGLGQRVNARYYLQIFDTQKGKSMQRWQQIQTDQPL